MARVNKFKKNSSTSQSHKSTTSKTVKDSEPSKVNSPPDSTSFSIVDLTKENDIATDVRPSSRRKVSSQTWTDGDAEPKFERKGLNQNAAIEILDDEPENNSPNPTKIQPSLPAYATALTGKYDIHLIRVSISSRLRSKVSAVLTSLENGFSLGKMDQNPGIVALCADAPSAANKLVSIIEITKRELQANKWRWYQYSGISGHTAQMKRKNMDHEKGQRLGSALAGASDQVTDENVSDDEDSFEIMGLEDIEKNKIRCVPILTIYLSRVPVPELKDELGEQNNEI